MESSFPCPLCSVYKVRIFAVYYSELNRTELAPTALRLYTASAIGRQSIILMRMLIPWYISSSWKIKTVFRFLGFLQGCFQVAAAD